MGGMLPRGLYGLIVWALCSHALAEQASQAGASPAVTVHLDFSVTVPEFLFFQLGPPGDAINLLEFSVPAGRAGDAQVIPAQGGDALDGTAVSAVLRSNAGQITLTESNNSVAQGLGNGKGQYISYDQIQFGSDRAGLPAPRLSDLGGNAAQPSLVGGQLTDQAAKWSARYLNETTAVPGVYGGEQRGGRVSVTAAAP